MISKRKITPVHTTIIYGVLMGVSLLLLQLVNYKTFIQELSLQTYGLILIMLGLGLGIWLAYHFLQTEKRNSLEIKNGKNVGLSERESEVLVKMAEGLSNQQIADELFVSLNTVKTHISNIYSKLHAKRRTQAIQRARDLGLIAE